MRFSLVIPCYNEAANIPLLLDRCRLILEQGNVEVLLVDNGSTDHSAAVLTDLLPQYPGIRCVRVEPNLGYGFGIICGLSESKGEILGWTHADMQTDPHDILAGLALFERHGDNIFVKGRRHGRPFADVAFTMGMSLFEILLLKQPLWDINAQPTMFSKEFFNTWKSPPRDFSLDLFAFFQACSQGLMVHRFPVRFAARAHGVSHWNINWAAKWRFIKRTINFSMQLKERSRHEDYRSPP